MNEYAGIPMPLEGQRLVIEPTYQRAEQLAAIGAPAEEPLPDGVVLRNRWWSRRLRGEVYIWNEPDGSLQWSVLPREQNLTMLLNTLGCSEAWGIEQESAAVHLLASLIKHHQFKQYMLTGMFLESSKRSGLTYLFRRLRPTVVLDARTNSDQACRILCALCMHPIAYYRDTWAGAMTPTDDVVAHLMLMRGDEPMLWRRSNQHPPYRPEAGI